MGDPACWLDRVCDRCGAVVDGPDEDGRARCQRCGEDLPTSDDRPPDHPRPA